MRDACSCGPPLFSILSLVFLFRIDQPRSDFADTVAGRRRDFQLNSSVIDHVADDGRAVEAREHKAAHTIDLLVLEREIEMLAELVQSDGARDANRSIWQ